jgi:hypothetical protein
VDEVELNVNMVGALMELGISHELDCTLIIDKKIRGLVLSASEVLKESSHPDYFFTAC